MNVLVTGCGGDIGQSIGKILAELDEVGNTFGIDINDRHAGKFIYNHFELGPPVKAAHYLDYIKDQIHTKQIDLVIPVAEPELRFYSHRAIEKETLGVPILKANLKSMQVGFDKLLTADFLQQTGLPYPKTVTATQAQGIGEYPVILKSRTGSGSKDVVKIANPKQLELHLDCIDKDEYILQEYIDDVEGEFTCGLFRSKQGEVRSIQFKREMMGSASGYGEKTALPEIEELLQQLAVALDLEGSINVQLRLREGVPYVFEINPRFSSTVYFRHLFGFRDVEWSIADAMGRTLPPYRAAEKLSKFYKGFHEFVD